MPSGAKKRRAARRKQQAEAQTKQTDDFTTACIVNLSIPNEELAEGAVLHEATFVDKELEQSNHSIGEVADEIKVATVDDNDMEENEVPLLNIISNEDNVVPNDVAVASQNAGCITESKESGENSKENQSLGVVSDDTRETERTSLLIPGVCLSNHSEETKLFTWSPEEIVEKVDGLLSYAMSQEEMREKYYGLLSETDTAILDYDKNRGFFLGEVELPVVAQPVSNENTVCSSAELVFDSNEIQAVSTITDSPATENEAHFASPACCSPKCTAIKEALVNLMAMVGAFESSMHTFKEDLQKTLDMLSDAVFA